MQKTFEIQSYGLVLYSTVDDYVGSQRGFSPNIFHVEKVAKLIFDNICVVTKL